MVEEEDDNHTHLLLHHPSSSFLPSNEPITRTGTIWTAIAHVITGVIGSGVLSLAWSVAQLGWISGPICLLVFGGVAIFVTNLLCDCYKSPDPEAGPTRNSSYSQAVKSYLGEKNMWVCGAFIHEGFYGYGIAYTITAAISMRAIQKSNCYHDEGHDAMCEYGYSKYMLIFGVVQVVFSQIPDFHNMAWLSVIAAIMSISYSSIGLGLGLAKTIGDGKIKGSITGVAGKTKLWAVAEALGDIAFAFTYNNILLEIEDTLKSPPPENQTMKKASTSAILITTAFYFFCGCFGYAAFGDDTPGNILTGFGFYEPYWLIDFANACVVLHLVGGYQSLHKLILASLIIPNLGFSKFGLQISIVSYESKIRSLITTYPEIWIYSQPVFFTVEKWLAKKLPDNAFVNNFYHVNLPFLPDLKLNLLRLCFRTAYVASTTVIAIIFPYFNDVLGVLGALNYWPLAIYFPIEMYIVQRKIRAWTSTWILFQVFRIICLVVTIVALIGSLEELVISTLS